MEDSASFGCKSADCEVTGDDKHARTAEHGAKAVPFSGARKRGYFDSQCSESPTDCEADAMIKEFSERKSAKEKGNKAYRHGDIEEALKYWELDARSCHLILARGIYADDAAKKQEIIDLLNAVEANMALGFLKQQRFEESLKFSKRVLKNDPSNIKMLYRYAEAAFEISKNDEALEALQKILRIDPGNLAALSLSRKIRDAVARTTSFEKKLMQRMLAESKDTKDSQRRGLGLWIARLKLKIAQILLFVRSIILLLCTLLNNWRP